MCTYIVAHERVLVSMMLGAHGGRVEPQASSELKLCMQSIYGELGFHWIKLHMLS